ncbi:RDD family protein [Longibaculum muris]|uniref:RDD family protein n=1 Tax=Longibaculum muris TaxID=1796628 RepID=UPI0022E0C5D3|nr:RDD family protein [Longibaculum muris]
MSKKKVTNKNDIIELRVKRFLAMVIDWYLTNMLAVIPITFYFRNGDYLQPYMFDFTHYDFQTALLLILYGIAIGLIYYIIIPVFLWKGQTLGKKICKIQIVDINENNITLKTMLLRELVGATLLEGGIVITATYLRKLLPVLGFTSFVEPLKYLAYGLTLLSILYAYFQPNSQSFHDKIAQTIIKKNKLYFPSFRDIYNIIIC